MASVSKHELLKWCQSKTRRHHNVHLKDFRESWLDGLGFCALIHAHQPGLIPYEALSQRNRIQNMKQALEVCSKHLGISRMVPMKAFRAGMIREADVVALVTALYEEFKARAALSSKATELSTAESTTPRGRRSAHRRTSSGSVKFGTQRPPVAHPDKRFVGKPTGDGKGLMKERRKRFRSMPPPRRRDRRVPSGTAVARIARVEKMKETTASRSKPRRTRNGKKARPLVHSGSADSAQNKPDEEDAMSPSASSSSLSSLPGKRSSTGQSGQRSTKTGSLRAAGTTTGTTGTKGGSVRRPRAKKSNIPTDRRPDASSTAQRPGRIANKKSVSRIDVSRTRTERKPSNFSRSLHQRLMDVYDGDEPPRAPGDDSPEDQSRPAWERPMVFLGVAWEEANQGRPPSPPPFAAGAEELARFVRSAKAADWSTSVPDMDWHLNGVGVLETGSQSGAGSIPGTPRRTSARWRNPAKGRAWDTDSITEFSQPPSPPKFGDVTPTGSPRSPMSFTSFASVPPPPPVFLNAGLTVHEEKEET